MSLSFHVSYFLISFHFTGQLFFHIFVVAVGLFFNIILRLSSLSFSFPFYFSAGQVSYKLQLFSSLILSVFRIQCWKVFLEVVFGMRLSLYLFRGAYNFLSHRIYSWFMVIAGLSFSFHFLYVPAMD